MMEYSAELRAGILPRNPFSFSDQVDLFRQPIVAVARNLEKVISAFR
jgi:hypothetical protein